MLSRRVLVLLPWAAAFAVEDTCVADGGGCSSDTVTMLQVTTKTGTLNTMETAPESPSACGFDADCPQSYTLADVNLLAEAQFSKAAETRAKLRTLQAKLSAICRGMADASDGVLEDGAWCYDESEAQIVPSKPNEVDQDFLLPLHHVVSDPGFAGALVQMLKKPDGSLYSISDFGAGVGQFGHFLKANLPTLEYHGYDGAGNVEEFTRNYVKFFDLSQPLALPKTDWVLSSEVGEHIPHEFEAQVIANLHAHNCKGIILTWAVLNQGGFHHVNDHSNDYLKKIFTGLGYNFNEEATQMLRANVTSSPWLQHSTMVFERVNPPAACK